MGLFHITANECYKGWHDKELRYSETCPNFEQKFREILKYFSLGIEGIKVAQLTGLNRNTVNKYLLLIKKKNC
jgi:hypothetical protein